MRAESYSATLMICQAHQAAMFKEKFNKEKQKRENLAMVRALHRQCCCSCGSAADILDGGRCRMLSS